MSASTTRTRSRSGSRFGRPGSSRTPPRSSAATSASCRTATWCSRRPRTRTPSGRSSRCSSRSASRRGSSTPDEVVERWPELEIEGIELACYEETSGYADPVRTVEALAGAAARDGLDVREGCEVLDDRRPPAGVSPGSSPPTARSRRAWSSTRRGRGGTRSGDGRRRVPDPVQPGARGDLPRPRGVPRAARHVGLGAAALLPLVPAPTRCWSARAGRRRPSRTTPRPTTRAPTTSTSGRMVPKLLRRVPALAATLAAARLRRRVRDRLLGRLRHHRGLVPDRRRGGGRRLLLGFGGSGHCFKIGPTIGESLAHVIAGVEAAGRHLEPVRLALRRRAVVQLRLGPGNRA